MRKILLFKILIFVFCISFFSDGIYGQTNWIIKNTSNSGLNNNIVNKLYQDNNGKIWIGTKNGLSIKNGEEWETYSKSNGMPHKWVTDISEDKDGKIWVATWKGIALFDGKNLSYIQKDDGLVNNRVTSVETDSKGNIWVGTKKGISVYDGQNWTNYTNKNGLINNWVIDIMEDVNGNMWFATRLGVSVFDGENWKSFTKNDGLARNFVGSMAEDGKGNIWFGTLNGAFSSYDGSNWEYTKKGSGYYNYNMLLVGALDGVVFTLLFNPVAGGAIFVLSAALGAMPSQLTHVYIDLEDNVWLAAQPKGVFMFDGKNWMQYSTTNGLPHKRVNTFLETNDGDLWIGTWNGIAIMDK